MNAARFFVDMALEAGQRIALPDAVAHHALRVLRLRDGADIILFNGSGGEFAARLIVDRASAQAEILSHDPVERESPLSITLVQAWIASDKLDWVVEKSVELGVNAIVLAPTRRSVVRLQGARLPRRVDHLREVARAACCQCGRNRLVTVTAVADLDTALKSSVADGRCGVLLDPTSGSELADAIGGASYALAVGPEGGFDAAEVAAATRLGFRAMRLGPRVLRTETAALAAIATLQAAAGDFGALGTRR
jgi:16S rRNA (uracil1498-N3)-methyltransferase